MNALTVLLALLAACANAAASVLMRRAAMEPGQGQGHAATEPKDDPEGPNDPDAPDSADGPSGPSRRGRRLSWLAGAGLLAGSAVAQAAALAVGSLSVVQPLLASELLFMLAIGGAVFHRRPGRTTWLSFLALAAGLALFLGAAAPSAGRATADASRWVPVAVGVGCAVLVLAVVARFVRAAPRAAVLGLASAVLFAATAALLKEVTGRMPEGPAALAAHWTTYATAVTGLAAFGLLQCAFRAGTLVASQPALTLGDALTSTALGWALFGEHIALGARVLPETAGVALIAAGTVGLARCPEVSGEWDARPASAPRPVAGRDGRRREAPAATESTRATPERA
ncbi:DMT family transporter [Streptomyces sp. 16-176A]|uniref:DMT family transporter n=1 Tax=Streptomyces sp. 16-176A TaxID=2530458 RepID=UPI00345C7FEA